VKRYYTFIEYNVMTHFSEKRIWLGLLFLVSRMKGKPNSLVNMSSIFRTAFILLGLISMAMGGLYVKKNAVQYEAAKKIVQIAPIIIGNNGSVRFPQRVPSPETVFQIQAAIQTDNATTLNALLIKHRFYVLPGRKNP